MIRPLLSRALARSTALGLIGVTLGVLVAALGGSPRARAEERVGLDYAYYSPVSLVLRDKHWVEDELGPGVTVQWVLSAGSNKALEFLRGRSIDFGSTAGSGMLR